MDNATMRVLPKSKEFNFEAHLNTHHGLSCHWWLKEIPKYHNFGMKTKTTQINYFLWQPIFSGEQEFWTITSMNFNFCQKPILQMCFFMGLFVAQWTASHSRNLFFSNKNHISCTFLWLDDVLPYRELTYPTMGKGFFLSSSKGIFYGIYWFPGG